MSNLTSNEKANVINYLLSNQSEFSETLKVLIYNMAGDNKVEYASEWIKSPFKVSGVCRYNLAYMKRKLIDLLDATLPADWESYILDDENLVIFNKLLHGDLRDSDDYCLSKGDLDKVFKKVMLCKVLSK